MHICTVNYICIKYSHILTDKSQVITYLLSRARVRSARASSVVYMSAPVSCTPRTIAGSKLAMIQMIQSSGIRDDSFGMMVIEQDNLEY